MYLLAALSPKKPKDREKLNITLVTTNEGWKITVTDQLLTELSKNPLVRLSGLVEERTPELTAWAENLDIKLFTPKELIGYSLKERLEHPPDHLNIDVLIMHSYGTDLGRQAQTIQRTKKCKWVHVVHTISQELAKYGGKEIHDSEHDVQVELCKRADMVIAIGPKVAEFYSSYLASSGNYVFDFTPGIADDLIKDRSELGNNKIFRIMVGATYYEKYFKAKGLDIAAQAIHSLQDTSYHILFLVKPEEDPKGLERRLKVHLKEKQFTVERFEKNAETLRKLLCRVQLAILPSREEGFGTTILLALSAHVPVIVGGDTGLGMALKKLRSGAEHVIDSEKPQDWADEIKKVREKGAGKCFDDAKQLRKEYMVKYNKTEQCKTLISKMLEMFSDKQGNQKVMTAAVVDHLRTVSLVYEAHL